MNGRVLWAPLDPLTVGALEPPPPTGSPLTAAAPPRVEEVLELDDEHVEFALPKATVVVVDAGAAVVVVTPDTVVVVAPALVVVVRAAWVVVVVCGTHTVVDVEPDEPPASVVVLFGSTVVVVVAFGSTVVVVVAFGSTVVDVVEVDVVEVDVDDELDVDELDVELFDVPPGDCAGVHVNLFGSEAAAVNVICWSQNFVTTPVPFAHAQPESQVLEDPPVSVATVYDPFAPRAGGPQVRPELGTRT